MGNTDKFGEYVDLGSCPATNSLYNLGQVVSLWWASVFKSGKCSQWGVNGQDNCSGVLSLRPAPSPSSWLIPAHFPMAILCHWIICTSPSRASLLLFQDPVTQHPDSGKKQQGQVFSEQVGIGVDSTAVDVVCPGWDGESAGSLFNWWSSGGEFWYYVRGLALNEYVSIHLFSVFTWICKCFPQKYRLKPKKHLVFFDVHCLTKCHHHPSGRLGQNPWCYPWSLVKFITKSSSI